MIRVLLFLNVCFLMSHAKADMIDMNDYCGLGCPLRTIALQTLSDFPDKEPLYIFPGVINKIPDSSTSNATSLEVNLDSIDSDIGTDNDYTQKGSSGKLKHNNKRLIAVSFNAPEIFDDPLIKVDKVDFTSSNSALSVSPVVVRALDMKAYEYLQPVVISNLDPYEGITNRALQEKGLTCGEKLFCLETKGIGTVTATYHLDITYRKEMLFWSYTQSKKVSFVVKYRISQSRSAENVE